MDTKERIQYIDLIKGFCIMLVVLNHSDVIASAFPDHGATTTLGLCRMPMFFFISGLFFRPYACFGDFATRKCCQLLIPYVFFILLRDVGNWLLIPGARSPWTPLTLWDMVVFNGYLWFLRALLLAGLLVFSLHRIAGQSRRRRAAVAALLFLAGWAAVAARPALAGSGLPGSGRLMFVPLQPVAMVLFYWLGHMAASEGLLSVGRTPRALASTGVVAAAALCALYCFNHQVCGGWAYLNFSSSWPAVVAFTLLGMTAVWTVSVLLSRLPFVSFLGRYSIVVLGLHGIVLGLLEYHTALGPWARAGATLALMPAAIWLFVRYLPWACARRQLLQWRDGRPRVAVRAPQPEKAPAAEGAR